MNKYIFVIVPILIVMSLGIYYFTNQNNLAQRKLECSTAGEQYYNNFITEQESQDLLFKDLDITHQVSYNSKLNTCLVYVDKELKNDGGHRSKFIRDVLNNKYLYLMNYGPNNEVLVGILGSSFSTDQEFMNKLKELFN